MNKYRNAWNIVEYNLDWLDSSEDLMQGVNLVKELVERATPKKIIYEPQALGRGFKQLCCPVCFCEADGNDYCWNCGQALEFREND